MIELSENTGFIAYRLPSEKDHQLCHIRSIHIRNKSSVLSDYDFVIAPYDRCNHNSYLLSFGNVDKNGSLPTIQLKDGAFDDVSKNEYLDTCQNLIKGLSNGNTSKVVLSRTKSINTSEVNISEIFMNMKAAYPEAFIYIFHHPDIGTWAAASPELLLSSIDDHVKTVALAGTRKYESSSNNEWGSKEIAEHKYIENYINEQLDKLNTEYQKSDTFTQRAANVEHIKSEYSIQLHGQAFIDVADILHPGPAISGYPVSDAMQIIKEIESHDRSFYCGYLGPINNQGNKYLYVNLRCMEIFNNGFKIYVGGGITQDSIAENEWIETELKSETLSDMLMSAYHEDHQ